MKTIQKNNHHILKLKKGEMVLATLKKYIEQENLNLCQINGIGALQVVQIGYLQRDGSYLRHDFNEDMEVLSLQGSISRVNNVANIHLHVNLGRRDFSTIGGHFFDGKVSGVLELFIDEIAPGKSPEFKLGL